MEVPNAQRGCAHKVIYEEGKEPKGVVCAFCPRCHQPVPADDPSLRKEKVAAQVQAARAAEKPSPPARKVKGPKENKA